MKKFSSLELVRNKILDHSQLKFQLLRWDFFSTKIVFTNGCFDILHLGHIDYLAKAADEGDVLVIGLNSDSSTSGLKGPKRPINGQEQRAMILASLHFVTFVVIFDEPTPYNLIKLVQPDVLIKGGDYKIEEIVGYDIVKAKNGIVKTIEFLPGYSTTSIEEKIIQLNSHL
jgi:D-glycero-beta-D-manno-heptose 1-phosphate adenylyltransferase